MSTWKTEKMGRAENFDFFLYESPEKALEDLREACEQITGLEPNLKFNERGELCSKGGLRSTISKIAKGEEITEIQFKSYGKEEEGILMIRIYEHPRYHHSSYLNYKNLMISKYLKTKFEK